MRPGGLIWVEVPDASHYVDEYVVPFYYFDIRANAASRIKRYLANR